MPPAAASTPSRSEDWWSIFDPRFSLRARAALGAAAAALLLSLLLGWIGSTLLRRQLEPQVAGAFETLAAQVSDKLDRTLFERYRTLQLVAALPAFRARETVADERRQMLAALQQASRDFAWIGFADAAGRVASATDRVFEGSHVANQPWFRSAREKPFARSVYEFPELASALPAGENGASGRFLDLAVPVTDADGRFAGVLGAHVRWDWAREVQLSVVPEAARRERLGVTVYAGNDVLLDSGASGWSYPPEPPVLGDRRRVTGSLLESTAEGTRYLTGFARSRGYREYKGLDWLVTVRQPASIALAPIAMFQRAVGLWGFLFTLALAVGAWFLTGRLTRRMRTMSAAAGRIREGDLLTVMPGPQGDAEFDRMCSAVRDLVQELRPKDTIAPASEPSLRPPPHSPTERIQRSV